MSVPLKCGVRLRFSRGASLCFSKRVVKFIEFTRNLQDIFLSKNKKNNPLIFLDPKNFLSLKIILTSKISQPLKFSTLKNKVKQIFQPSKLKKRVYRQFRDANSQRHKKIRKKCQLRKMPVGGSASWGKCQLKELNPWTGDFFPTLQGVNI